MGASASKAARTAGSAAAGASQRRYPTNPTTHIHGRQQPPSSSSQASPSTSPSPQHSHSPGPTADAAGPRPRPTPRASASRDPAIDADARDPHLAGNLRELGPVQPSPTFSPSAAPGPQTPGPGNNAALATLDARRRLEDAAEAETARFGKPGFAGRRLLDVDTIRRALVLRDEKGLSAAEVEARLGLAGGVVGGLGRVGVVEAA